MKRIHFVSNLIVTLFIVFLATTQAWAQSSAGARVYFRGPEVEVAPESEISVSLLIDANQSINALDLEVSYPKSKLKLLGFDNAQSIVTLWQNEAKILPSGAIGFSGGMFKPFLGTQGLVGKLSFKVLKPGQAQITYRKNTLYLADGQATTVVATASPVNIEISEDGKAVELAPSLPDDTPPILTLTPLTNPADGQRLIVYLATDPESGIKQTEMRVKKWWSYEEWQPVTNPIVYPDGVWTIEVKATNNLSGETSQILSYRGELVKKIGILSLALLALVFIIFRVYNNRRKKKI